MSKIRAKGNEGTEIALMRILRTNGIAGWRRHVVLKFDAEKMKSSEASTGAVTYKPQALVDFIFRREKVIIFVDGCFWHGCPKHSNRPVNNKAFWNKKLEGNEVRDRWVTKTLRRHGWRVVRIWEHELELSLKGRMMTEKRIIAKIHKILGIKF